jgi:hypothetical protein
MSKRFIDTEIFNDSWFMNLSSGNKLFFIYLITNCNASGIIDLNIRLAEFQTGVDGLANSLGTVWEQFGEKQPVHLRENYYFLPNFIRYQYPNGLSSNVKAQQSVIEKLLEFSIDPVTLSKQLGNSLLTVQDKEIYKEKDKEIYKGGVGEKEVDHNLIFSIANYFGFSEIRNGDKFSQIFMFLNILESDGQTEHFREQFNAYREYKEKSKEARFAFPRFIGTIDQRYQDGGWNSRNWVHELQNMPGPDQGKVSIKDYNQSITEKLKIKVS